MQLLRGGTAWPATGSRFRTRHFWLQGAVGGGNVHFGPYHSGREGGRTKSGQLTPGEEIRVRAPEREKRVQVEPLRRARNLLGFATFQAAQAGLYYCAAG